MSMSDGEKINSSIQYTTINEKINPDYEVSYPDTRNDSILSEKNKYSDYIENVGVGYSGNSINTIFGMNEKYDLLPENVDFSDIDSIPISSQYSIDTNHFILVVPFKMIYVNGKILPRYNLFFNRLRELSIDCDRVDMRREDYDYIVLMLRGNINSLFTDFLKRQYTSATLSTLISSELDTTNDSLTVNNNSFNRYIEMQKYGDTNTHRFLFSDILLNYRNGQEKNRYDSHKYIFDVFIDNYNFFIDNRNTQHILYDPIRSYLTCKKSEKLNSLMILDVCSALSSRNKKYMSRIIKFIIDSFIGDLYTVVETENPYLLPLVNMYLSLGFSRPQCIDKLYDITYDSKMILLSLKSDFDIREGVASYNPDRNFTDIPGVTIKDRDIVKKRDITKIYNILSELNGLNNIYPCTYNFLIEKNIVGELYNKFVIADYVDTETSGLFYVRDIVDDKLVLDYDMIDIAFGKSGNVSILNYFVWNRDELKDYNKERNIEDLVTKQYEYGSRMKGRKKPYLTFHTHYKNIRYTEYRGLNLFRVMIPSYSDIDVSFFSFVYNNVLCHLIFTDNCIIKIGINIHTVNLFRHLSLLCKNIYIFDHIFREFIKEKYIDLIVDYIPELIDETPISSLSSNEKEIVDLVKLKIIKFFNNIFTLEYFFTFMKHLYTTGIYGDSHHYYDLLVNHTNIDLYKDINILDVEIIDYTPQFDFSFSQSVINNHHCDMSKQNMLVQGQQKERIKNKFIVDTIEENQNITSENDYKQYILGEEYKKRRGI